MFTGRPVGSIPRYLELLEALKQEFEHVQSEANGPVKLQREDYEYKLQMQLNDLSHIQKNLVELEKHHLKMKNEYEEEIARLTRELSEATGKPIGSPLKSNAPRPPLLGLSGAPSGTALTGLFSSGGLSENLKRMSVGYEDALIRNMKPRGVEGIELDRRLGGIGDVAMAAALPPPPPSSSASLTPQAVNVASPSTNSSVTSKKDGYDWLVVYNPKMPRNLSVDLLHNIAFEGVVCCVKFSNDGKILAAGGNKICHLYDVTTGTRISSLSHASEDGSDLYVRSVSFSGNDSIIATGSEDSVIRVWNVQSGELLAKLTGHDLDVYSLDFVNDDVIASGSGDQTVKIWNYKTATCLRTISAFDASSQGKDAGITSVAISHDRKYISAGSLDRIVRVWEVESGELIEKYDGHSDSVYSVSFSVDDQSIVSASLDKTIKIWSFNPLQPLRNTCLNTLSGHKDFVLSVAVSPDDHWILSGSKDRTVQFWDAQNEGAAQLMLQGHKNSVISVAISKLGGVFATGSGDCRARIWSYSDVSKPAVIEPTN